MLRLRWTELFLCAPSLHSGAPLLNMLVFPLGLSKLYLMVWRLKGWVLGLDKWKTIALLELTFFNHSNYLFMSDIYILLFGKAVKGVYSLKWGLRTTGKRRKIHRVKRITYFEMKLTSGTTEDNSVKKEPNGCWSLTKLIGVRHGIESHISPGPREHFHHV